jgi:hypothetical protein
MFPDGRRFETPMCLLGQKKREKEVSDVINGFLYCRI